MSMVDTPLGACVVESVASLRDERNAVARRPHSAQAQNETSRDETGREPRKRSVLPRSPTFRPRLAIAAVDVFRRFLRRCSSIPASSHPPSLRPPNPGPLYSGEKNGAPTDTPLSNFTFTSVALSSFLHPLIFPRRTSVSSRSSLLRIHLYTEPIWCLRRLRHVPIHGGHTRSRPQPSAYRLGISSRECFSSCKYHLFSSPMPHLLSS
jgi:hypothetical protein